MSRHGFLAAVGSWVAKGSAMSRQSWGQGIERLGSRQCNREFSVVTGLAARWLLGYRDLGFWVATRPGWWGSVMTECTATTLSVQATARSAHAVRTIARAMCTHYAHDRPCDSA